MYEKLELDSLTDEGVYYFPIQQTPEIKKASIELYNELENTKIPIISGHRKERLGANNYTFTFGCGFRMSRGVGDFVANTNHPKLFDLLIKYGNLICPDEYEYNAITVNRDMKANKHTDGSNSGKSIISGLGDFDGGELYVYYDDKKVPYNLKKHICIFNGALLAHRTAPFSGRRYTLVYYSQRTDCKVKGKKMIGENDTYKV
jgi:hypothetical protein